MCAAALHHLLEAMNTRLNYTVIALCVTHPGKKVCLLLPSAAAAYPPLLIH